MPYYMVQAAYTPAAMSSMIQGPQDRPRQLRTLIEKLAGSLEGFWLSFGEYDMLAICQMPDDESMAALAMAISADGTLRAIKTTALITWTEGLHAMKRASESVYPSYGAPTTTV